ncbi:hypothetical protein GCM10009741_27420 [Kribbella lupini]|uniref:Uncharacterized protein n=1 Tax=Kribbella lupini TaxID=291602 RepID=A0ABN2AQW5_9ACTN
MIKADCDPIRCVVSPTRAHPVPAAHTITTVSSIPRGRCIRCPPAVGKYPATVTTSRRVTGRPKASVTNGRGTTTIR